MIKNTLKKVVGFGMALCMAGTFMLATPTTVSAEYIDIAPLCIYDYEGDGEEG